MAKTKFSGPVESTNGFIGDIAGNLTGNINGVVIEVVEGVPALQKFAKNTLVLDVTNSDLYINDGDATTPTYKKFTRATT